VVLVANAITAFAFVVFGGVAIRDRWYGSVELEVSSRRIEETHWSLGMF
jgi:hypothetical protein